MKIQADQLRICFVAGTLGQGGAERQLFYMLRALKRLNAEVHLITLTKGELWEQPIREAGVQVHYAGQESGQLKRLNTIYRLLKQIRPDIIQSQHFYVNLYAGLAGRALGIPVIGGVRNSFTLEMNDMPWPKNKLCAKLPNYIASNSQEAITNMKAAGFSESSIFYLPNVVDTETFKPGPNGAHEVVTLAGLGRLVEFKRHDIWIEAIAQLKNKTSIPFKAVLGGYGPLQEQLERQAGELKLQDVLSFTGAVKKPDQYLKKADIFVLTSSNEGTPNVVLEAMSTGLAVVSSNVGNVFTFMESGRNGIVVDQPSPEAFADALLPLLENAEERKRLGTAARNTILETFSENALVERLLDMYSKVLGKA